jgi:hypothetical protein
MRCEPPKAPLTQHFHNKKVLHNVRNLPETPIIFLVYSPKSYKMCLAYQKQQFHTVLTI